MAKKEDCFETQTRIIDDAVIVITPHSASYLEWMDKFNTTKAEGSAMVSITAERIRIRIQDIIHY